MSTTFLTMTNMVTCLSMSVPMIDEYLGMELIMDVGTNNEQGARVVKRARTDDGKAIGTAHSNPILDTRAYEIEFADGTRDKVTANIIAENMHAQIDDQGNSYILADPHVKLERSLFATR